MLLKLRIWLADRLMDWSVHEADKFTMAGTRRYHRMQSLADWIDGGRAR